METKLIDVSVAKMKSNAALIFHQNHGLLSCEKKGLFWQKAHQAVNTSENTLVFLNWKFQDLNPESVKYMNIQLAKNSVLDYLFLFWCYLFFHLSVYHMKETGWVKVSQSNVKDLHYQYQEEKEAAS